jgi:hypothetical protein
LGAGTQLWRAPSSSGVRLCDLCPQYLRDTTLNHTECSTGTEITVNGSRNARWPRLKKLARTVMPQKQKEAAATRPEAYADYWQVRNHRATTPNGPNRK